MPAVNPRRECGCQSGPIVSARFQEEATGAKPFIGLAVAAVVLVAAGPFVVGWGGWLGWAILIVAGLALILLAVVFGEEWRGQRRFGLGWVRLDDSSFTLGGSLKLHVGTGRGLSGLRGLSATVRCIDAVKELRNTGEGTERERICYVVWEDERTLHAKDLPAQGEASFRIQLPSEGEFAGPVGDHLDRYWEVEVIRFGMSAMTFQVLVHPPAEAKPAAEVKAAG